MTQLHAKYKGTLGELAVAQELIQSGYPVFSELGDNSKVDLIALVPEPVKIQVKAKTSSNGVVHIDSRKSGPNYRFRYTVNDVDIFAVYILDNLQIIYLTCLELLERKSITSLRLQDSRRKDDRIRYVRDYRDFDRALNKFRLGDA